jgi:dTDP-4-amino-4,6-dideoxygalactose transaminase
MVTELDIPLLDLKAQYAQIKDEIEPKILKFIEKQYFIMGPEVAEFEREAARYCGSTYAVGVSSGTDALLMPLMTLGLEPGDEVITSPFTFFATGGSIARLGLKPVFVDIDPKTYNIQAELIEEKVTPRTRVIMPVHLFGQSADMDPIIAIANKYNLTVIEDSAQSIGAVYKGKRSGSIGHFGAFSFFPSKNLGCFGDAGMVTTNDPSRYEMLAAYRTHGGRKKYYHDFVGGNFRIDTLQCLVLKAKLPHLDRWCTGRRQNAAAYKTLFAESGILKEQTHNGQLVLSVPSEQDDRFHVFNQFCIRTPFRDGLMEGLKAAKIGCEIYYPLPLHLQKCFSYLGHRVGDFPESEKAANEILAIPIFPELGAARLHVVGTKVIDILRNLSRKNNH